VEESKQEVANMLPLSDTVGAKLFHSSHRAGSESEYFVVTAPGDVATASTGAAAEVGVTSDTKPLPDIATRAPWLIESLARSV